MGTTCELPNHLKFLFTASLLGTKQERTFSVDNGKYDLLVITQKFIGYEVSRAVLYKYDRDDKWLTREFASTDEVVATAGHSAWGSFQSLDKQGNFTKKIEGIFKDSRITVEFDSKLGLPSIHLKP